MPADVPQPASPHPARDLLQASGGAAQERAGSLRAAVANAMVGLKKKYYGRGPDAAKAWFLDDYVFVAMEGGLTPNEETLLADGKEDLVRAYRLSFEETMTAMTIGAVQELTGREVLTYHSQIVFGPARSFEIFVLAPERSGDGAG
ncbi:MAG TPA: Na-translocating system protein MpsC family protein [Baekduia sp.]|jgi:uncharacterized protein YbcI|nr:Na-translocating system protein MpsC family protein [Baekduia sp.]